MRKSLGLAGSAILLAMVGCSTHSGPGHLFPSPTYTLTEDQFDSALQGIAADIERIPHVNESNVWVSSDFNNNFNVDVIGEVRTDLPAGPELEALRTKFLKIIWLNPYFYTDNVGIKLFDNSGKVLPYRELGDAGPRVPDTQMQKLFGPRPTNLTPPPVAPSPSPSASTT